MRDPAGLCRVHHQGVLGFFHQRVPHKITEKYRRAKKNITQDQHYADESSRKKIGMPTEEETEAEVDTDAAPAD